MHLSQSGFSSLSEIFQMQLQQGIMSLIQIQIGHSVCLRVCFLHVEMKKGCYWQLIPSQGFRHPVCA